MNNFKKILIIALLVSIGARFYINFFIDGFIISFSVIILLLALYFYNEINPIYLSFSVAIISPLMRLIIDVFLTGNFNEIFMSVYPDTFFYISFGLIYSFVKKILKESYIEKFYIITFTSDFFSNIVELLIRTKVFALSYDMVKGLLLVAISRTFVIFFIIFLAKMYKSMLQREEHENRYKYLLTQSSRFKSEIYFLNKNSNQIESIMKLSHSIYKTMSLNNPLKEKTLELTKEIHEVKKDYFRVIQGLEELYFENSSFEEMNLKDLLVIMIENTEEMIKTQGIKAYIHYKCRVNIMIKKHYYIMSIFRNLINNSLESFDSMFGDIFIECFEISDELIITFTDNGIGILEDELEYVFNPGFSTKYNDKTGDVSRGLGLSLVKDMIEGEFGGSIKIIEYQGGCKFELKFLKEKL